MYPPHGLHPLSLFPFIYPCTSFVPCLLNKLYDTPSSGPFIILSACPHLSTLFHFTLRYYISVYFTLCLLFCSPCFVVIPFVIAILTLIFIAATSTAVLVVAYLSSDISC
ncbi:MAG: hypothetical protein J3R72DRAFT_446819 [Linnemannia gamsii]|nr:MAG: hypothetical protein J3R72DRAFT_446819 [Linnemannia gamsii]